jgi:hypothetical protein
MGHTEPHTIEEAAKIQSRSRIVDRLIWIGVIIATAALSTYYTAQITIGQLQRDVAVIQMQTLVLRENQVKLMEKVNTLETKQGFEDAQRDEIIRRLSKMENTLDKLMELMGHWARPPRQETR